MNIKLILPLFLSLLFLVTVPCHADPASDDVWVAVAFSDKGPNEPATEYYGAIDRKLLTSIMAAPVPTGFIRLSHVALMSANGRIVPLSETRGNIRQGYSRIMYFRVESIVRIIELDPQFVKDFSFDLTEKK